MLLQIVIRKIAGNAIIVKKYNRHPVKLPTRINAVSVRNVLVVMTTKLTNVIFAIFDKPREVNIYETDTIS